MAPMRPLVLTVAEAARQLRLRRDTARALLHNAGLIHVVGDSERVLWADVEEAIRHGSLKGAGQPPPEQPSSPPTRRGTLKATRAKGDRAR